MIAEHGTRNPGVMGSRRYLFFYEFPFHVFWWGVGLSGVIYEVTHRLPVENLFSFFVVITESVSVITVQKFIQYSYSPLWLHGNYVKLHPTQNSLAVFSCMEIT